MKGILILENIIPMENKCDFKMAKKIMNRNIYNTTVETILIASVLREK
jgi:hypothetical protein